MAAIQGPLWEGVVPGILRRLFVGRKTGPLSFVRKDERRGVRFRGGNIVSADSSVREDWMGEMLVRQGGLSRADLKRAVGFMLRDKRRLGVVLMELGLLDGDGLEEAVAAHVKQVLSKVFSWSDGSYHFQEEPEDRTREGDVTLRLSTGELILEAARSVEDPDVIRFNLGDIDRALTLSNDPLLRFQRISLSPADGYVLSRVDGTLTARDLEKLIPLSEEQFHRSLFGLLSAGVVDFLPGETEAESEPEPGAAQAASALAASSDADREPAPARTASSSGRVVDANLASPVEERPAETATKTPPPGESEVEKTMIIPAPGELPFEEAMAPPQPGESAVEKTILIPPPGESAVEQTMVMPPLRDLAIGRAMPMPASASDPPDSQAPPEPSEVEKTLRLPPIDTRRLEVLAAHENLRARTHFEVLGVPRHSTEAEVREAYFRLAKRFHPDVHHDPGLSDLREALEEVFGRLGEAYEVLCSPRLRARYESVLAHQTDAPEASARRDPGEEAKLAAEAIEKAAESLSQGRHWEAIQMLEPAISRVEGEARLRGRILLARAYAKDPKWVKQGEELLVAVLQDEPESNEALLLLARIYGGLGLRSRAVTMLRRVLDRHPDHEEARALIAEIERERSPSSGEGPGRPKNWFGRKPV